MIKNVVQKMAEMNSRLNKQMVILVKIDWLPYNAEQQHKRNGLERLQYIHVAVCGVEHSSFSFHIL